MSRYDHKIETSLEGIEHLSKEKKEEIERKMKEKNNYWPKVRDSKLNDWKVRNKRIKEKLIKDKVMREKPSMSKIPTIYRIWAGR